MSINLMTTTTTITQTSAAQSLVLHLNQKSLREMGYELAQEMQGSELFSLSEKNKIQEWESEFQLMDVDNPEISEDVSIQLVFLLIDVVYPAIVSTAASKQLQLLKFEDQLKEILKVSIPKNMSVDQFIKECEEFDKELVIFRSKLAVINFCFEQQMKLLYDFANETNNELMQQFAAVKQALLELTEKGKSIADQMHGSLAVLTQKIDLLIAKLTSNAAKIQSVGQKMQSEEQTFKQILLEFQDTFQKGKI